MKQPLKHYRRLQRSCILKYADIHQMSSCVLRCVVFVSFILPGIFSAFLSAFGQDLPRSDDVRIHRIDISGLHSMTYGQVISLLELEENDYCSLNQLHHAVEQLNYQLSSQTDFLFSSVDSCFIQFSIDSSYADITIEVNEGPAVVVDTLYFSGPVAAHSESLRDLIGMEPGESFARDRLNAGLEATVRYFEQQGFPFARTTIREVQPHFRENDVGVTLEIHVLPGRAVQIDRAEIAGLTRTNHHLVERALHFPTGFAFNAWQAERGRLRLMNTGWFSQVTGPEIFQDTNGQFGVVYLVEEQKTSSIAGGIGYAPSADESDGLMGNLDIRLGNILGTGRDFSLEWERANESQHTFSIQYTEPYVFGSPVTLIPRFEQEYEESLYVAVSAALGANMPVSDAWRIEGEIKTRSVNADSLSTGPDSSDFHLLGGSLALRFDNRNHPSNPTSGVMFHVMSEQSRLSLDDDSRLLQRNSVDFRYLFSMSSSWVMYTRFYGAEVHMDAGRTPVSEWYRFGGANSIRGYPERFYAGNKLGIMNCEWRKVFSDEGRLFFLFDTAVYEANDPAEWVWSYGIGIQLATGMGILQAAAALPGEEGLNSMVIHTRLITRF